MKKYFYAFSIAVLCLVVMLLASCANREETIEPALKHPKWSDVKLEDIKPLRKLLTQKYDLEELTEFFEERSGNVDFYGNPPLLFSEVNEMFPVEVFRPGDYTVYKVRQGGYFYVFWYYVVPYDPDGGTASEGEYAVYFTAYLRKKKDIAAFDSLIPGVSTAEDVRKIDPYLEIDFLRSSGTFSYSYLNKDEILEVKYKEVGNIDGYDDLIVENIEILSKSFPVSRYSYILQQDLP